MAGLSNYLEDKILRYILRANNGSLVSPSTVYLGLFTADPADVIASEVTGGSYARKAITFNDPTTNGTAMRCSNSAVITFPQATASWGTITHFGIFDALSGGNLLVTGALSASKAVANTDTIEFAAGSITVDTD